MKSQLIGLAVVIGVAGVMWLGWLRYEDFLTQGSRPPKSTQILNEMQESGVPDFTLKNLKGKKVSLSDYSDKVVIINFWASWCDPCAEEFPSLLKLVNHFNGDIVLLAVSADSSKEDMVTFLEAFGAKDNPYVEILWDKDQKVAQKYGTMKLPESYILGNDQRLVRKIAGVDQWYGTEPIGFFKELIRVEHSSAQESASTTSN